jgi:hypothetical protein
MIFRRSPSSRFLASALRWFGSNGKHCAPMVLLLTKTLAHLPN